LRVAHKLLSVIIIFSFKAKKQVIQQEICIAFFKSSLKNKNEISKRIVK
jgi:hypothetical protein